MKFLFLSSALRKKEGSGTFFITGIMKQSFEETPDSVVLLGAENMTPFILLVLLISFFDF